MGALCVQACPLGWVGVRECRPSQLTHPALVGSQVCYHHGNNADPEERDCPAAFSDIQDVQILSRFVRDHLPDLEPEPAVVEHCMYTVRGRAAPENSGRRQIGLAPLRLDSSRLLTSDVT